MSGTQTNKRLFATVLGVIILVMGSFAAIGLSPRPSGDTFTSNTTNNTTNNTTSITTNITSQEVAITCSTHSFMNVDNSTGGGCKQPSYSDLAGTDTPSWSNIQSFPSGCSTVGTFVTTISSTPTCSPLAFYHGSLTGQSTSQAVGGVITSPSTNILVHVGCYLIVVTVSAGTVNCIVDFREANTNTHISSFILIPAQNAPASQTGDAYLWIHSSTSFEIDSLIGGGFTGSYDVAATATIVATTP